MHRYTGLKARAFLIDEKYKQHSPLNNERNKEKKMNINELTIGQAREIAEMFGLSDKKDILSHMIGKKVLIRDHKAGIFVTTLVDVSGKEWRGADSRKIHYWEKAGAVQGISITGFDYENSRISVTTQESNGKELIECLLISDEIYTEIMEAKAWNPK